MLWGRRTWTFKGTWGLDPVLKHESVVGPSLVWTQSESGTKWNRNVQTQSKARDQHIEILVLRWMCLDVTMARKKLKVFRAGIETVGFEWYSTALLGWCKWHHVSDMNYMLAIGFYRERGSASHMLASKQHAKQQMLPCPLTKRLAKPRMGPEPDKGYVLAWAGGSGSGLGWPCCAKPMSSVSLKHHIEWLLKWCHCKHAL